MTNPKKISEHNSVSGKSTLKQLSRVYRELSPYLNIGYTFVAAIALLGYIGYLIDQWKGTSPWATFIGLLLGMVVGFYQFFLTVFNRSKEDQNDHKDA
ncbi:MAG: AtpZ/AtpI family protein [Calditrichaeota bacterium]|nr:MAG: AtpZ/AtpI family protein [Calditrichota bacterium]